MKKYITPKKYIILAIIFLIIYWAFSFNSFVPPSSVDVYYEKGKYISIQNPTIEKLKPISKIWNLWYTLSSRILSTIPKTMYQSYNYENIHKMIVLHYDTPIVWRGTKTKEIHIIYNEDDFIDNRVYLKDENGNWRIIEVYRLPLKSPVLKTISNLTQ